MEGLIKQAEARVLEAQRTANRAEMKELIAKYENIIKTTIEQFYADHVAEIARFRMVQQELKSCTDRAQLGELLSEVMQFKKLLPKTENLLVLNHYNRISKTPIFPIGWDAKVIYEMLARWEAPVVDPDAVRLLDLAKKHVYEIKADRGLNHVKIGTTDDYKEQKMWIDLAETLMECYLWREYFGLEHLQALVGPEIE